MLIERVGNNSTSFIFVLPSATSFFCAPKKIKEKKGAPAGGLHSAKRLWRLYVRMWPAQLGFNKNVRCETDSRAVRNGFN